MIAVANVLAIHAVILQIDASAKKMIKSIIILIDGVNPKQMREFMPKLTEYSKSHYFSEVTSMLGYSSGIHPSIWTGKYQDENERFTTFYYEPENSPFKWVKYLRIIPTNFLRKYLLAALKAPYFLMPGGKTLTPGFIKRAIIPLPPAMPVNIAPNFACSNQEISGTIFDELRQNYFISFSRQSDSNGYFGEFKTLEEMHLTNNMIDFFYFHEADDLGHIHGPDSEEVKNYLSKADDKIFELMGEVKEANLIVFSDHGMCKVNKFVNIQKVLSKTWLRKGKDYIAFYDSTMARFWPLNDRVKETIVNVLSNVDGITLLDEKLLEKYRINFKNKRKFGELIFLAKPETRIFPDYFSPVKGGIKGWHGFDPDFPDSKAILVTNLPAKKEMKIVGIYSLIRQSLNLTTIIG